MSVVVDTLITRFRLEDQFSGPSRRVVESSGRTSRAMGIASSVARAGGKAMAAIGSGITALVGAVGTIGGVIGPALSALEPLISGAMEMTSQALSMLFEEIKTASGAAADFEPLVMGLEAVEGSAEKARATMADLRRLAAAPGLGFEEAISGYTQLRKSGMVGGFAREMIKQIANSNARVGGGREAFDGTISTVARMAKSKYLQGDELEQLESAGIPAQGIVQRAFGTTDAEQLKANGVTTSAVLAAVTQELQKQERAVGGVRDSFTSLEDAIKFARIEAGRGINEGLKPMADALTNVFEIASDGGVFRSLGDDIARLFQVDTSGFENFLINLVAAFKTGFQIATGIVKILEPLLSRVVPWFMEQNGISKIVDPLFQLNRAHVASSMRSSSEQRERDQKKSAEPEVQPAELDRLVTLRDYAAETADNTRQLVQIGNEQIKLDNRMIGGGGFSRMAIHDLGFTRAIGGKSKIQKAVGLIEQHVREMIALDLGASNRRMGYSPVRQ